MAHFEDFKLQYRRTKALSANLFRLLTISVSPVGRIRKKRLKVQCRFILYHVPFFKLYVCRRREDRKGWRKRFNILCVYVKALRGLDNGSPISQR